MFISVICAVYSVQYSICMGYAVQLVLDCGAGAAPEAPALAPATVMKIEKINFLKSFS